MSADSLTEEEVVYSLTSALAENLNIHPSNLEVSYNPDTSEATYTIESELAEAITDIIAIIQADEFQDSLVLDEIVIDSVTVSDDIIASIDVIVDASNTENPDISMTSVIDAIQSQDASYEIVGDGK